MFEKLKSYLGISEQMMIHAGAVSFIGIGKNVQQDNFYMYPNTILTANDREKIKSKGYLCYTNPIIKSKNAFMAISDGLGGYKGGEYASWIVVNQLQRLLPTVIQNPEFSNKDMHHLIHNIHNTLLNETNRYKEYAHMSATLTGLWIVGDDIYTVNVGDSCIYHYVAGRLYLLTKAQNMGNLMIDKGLLTLEEVNNFPDKDVMHSCMGIKENEGGLKIDIKKVSGCEADEEYFLLCSDGLPKELDIREMEMILNTCLHNNERLEKIALNLTDAAVKQARMRKKGTDNITVMIVKVDY